MASTQKSGFPTSEDEEMVIRSTSDTDTENVATDTDNEKDAPSEHTAESSETGASTNGKESHDTQSSDDIDPIDNLRKELDLCRKRERSPEVWTRNMRKEASLRGDSYVTARGKVIEAKRIGPPCTCRRQCYDLIPEQSKKTIFDSYYKLPTKESQRSYLKNLMIAEPVKKRYSGQESKRNITVKYYVPTEDGNETQICKQAFANIHGLKLSRLDAILESKQRDQTLYEKAKFFSSATSDGSGEVNLENAFSDLKEIPFINSEQVKAILDFFPHLLATTDR